MQRISHTLFSLIFLLSCLTGTSQTSYRAGFAKASIEPGSFPFSLALAGYGAPREGRFSLDWIKCDKVSPATAFTGQAGDLLIISDGDVRQASVSLMNWSTLAGANGIKLLAGGQRNLYGIDSLGNVYLSAPRKRLGWRKVGFVKDPVAVAASAKELFVADRSGVIYRAATSQRTLKWDRLTGLPGVQSIVSHLGSIYALTSNNDILKFDLSNSGGKWLKVAGFNNVSYDVHIQHLAVSANTLYGIDDDGNIYKGAHQTDGNLSVTALAIGSGKQTAIIVGADLCGFNHEFISSIKEEVFRKLKIPASAILINASHTHFAPVSQNWLTWGEHTQIPDSVYLNNTVRPALVNSIVNAVRNMSDAELFFGRGSTAIGANRSITESPVPHDKDVDVLTVIQKKSKEKTVLFSTGCHPVFNNSGAEGFRISPNFPGVTRSILEKDSGISNGIFIQGCAGDINPLDMSHQVTGEKLASEIKKVLGRPMQKLSGGVSCFLDSLNFPVKHWDKDRILAFRKENQEDKGNVGLEKNVRWADLMLKLEKENNVPSTLPVYVQTLNIGSWKLVGLSREAVTEYSIGIKKIWPDKLVSVAGYCNDVSSYLPTERHINAGVYEGIDSFFWYGQPSLFPESVLGDIISRIKENNH
ncbi:hypothetical protein [Arcticibacter sp.]|uniref:hypothetical protein n=1 Tax=Arcticibacter sp. TaxID=1872630 RepID=UPI00389090D2